MFFIIRYGENKREFFNPDCSLDLLVDNIRRRCQCPSDYGIAVVDEKCCIIQLSDEIATSTCTCLFADRGTYILLAVDKRDSPPKYIPLLDEIEPELAARLDVLSNPKGDQKFLKSWNKASRTSKQSGSTPLPGQARRKQSAVPSGMMLKRKFKPNLERPL